MQRTPEATYLACKLLKAKHPRDRNWFEKSTEDERQAALVEAERILTERP